MELLRWLIVIALLGFCFYCAIGNWALLLRSMRAKRAQNPQSVPSMLPFVGGLAVYWAWQICPHPSTFWLNGLFILLWLLEPGSGSGLFIGSALNAWFALQDRRKARP